MAEEVGFEPTDLSIYGFQDRRLQPLGHSSVKTNWKIILNCKNQNTDYNTVVITPDLSDLTNFIGPHIMPQDLGYYNRTVILLEILQNCRQCTSNCQARTI